ncbi:MAG: hypothetical protein PHU06_10165 [Gallionella sp.]|nr:hypothetical protein [Gallionella sp.]MDD4958952.1 hypothetical protein [Gallionella sp.]
MKITIWFEKNPPNAETGLQNRVFLQRRLLVTQLHVSGKSAGSLYFVSTFGSAVGTICTSFYLVLWFEINQIFIGMIGISVVLGLLAIALGGLEDVE